MILAFVGVKMIISQRGTTSRRGSRCRSSPDRSLAASTSSCSLQADRARRASPTTEPPPPDDVGRAGTSRRRAHPRSLTRHGDRRRRHRSAPGDRVDRRRRSSSTSRCDGSGATGSGLCPFHAEKSAVVQRPRARPAGTSASAAARRATCSRSSRRSTRRLRRRGRAPRGQGRHAAHVHDAGQGKERQRRKRSSRRWTTAVDWYHRRLLDIARRPPGPRLPAQSGARRRRGPPVPARLGARRLGRAAPRCRRRWRAAAQHRPGVHQPARPDAGRLPGPGAVPDLLRHREAVAFGGRVLPGSDRSGEVQELAGDADLRQVARRSTA